MRISKISQWALVFLLAMMPTQVFGQGAGKNISLEVSAFVDGFISDYNEKNFKAIYRDLSSGRFKASENFANFHNSMLNLFEDLGTIQKYEIDYLLRDSYNFGEFVFYRLQLNAYHAKGETVQRLVLMKRKNIKDLELDGYAVASNGLFYAALGNLYNFNLKDLVDGKDALWTSPYFSAVWQDARRDYLHSGNFKKKVNANLQRSLWSVLLGDFDKAVKLIKDPGQLKIESYTATEAYSNGKTKWVVPYVNGKKSGETKFFYESGQVWQIVNYKNNLVHGDFTEFHPNGQIKLKSRYINGLPVGQADAFYEDGKVRAKFEFVFGQLLYKYQEFAEDGSLKGEGTYLLGKEVSLGGKKK